MSPLEIAVDRRRYLSESAKRAAKLGEFRRFYELCKEHDAVALSIHRRKSC